MTMPEAYTSPAFWQRPFAMMIDLVIIAALGQIVILFFFPFLKFHLILSHIIGVLLSVGYFAITDSHLTQGMSPGKRLLRIRLVNQEGAPLPTWQAAARSVLPLTPVWLFGIPLVGSQILHAIVVFGGFSIILIQWGLYLIDRPARMMIQDRWFKTTVTREHENALPQTRLTSRKVLVLVCFVFLSLSAIWHFKPPTQNENHPFSPLKQALLSDSDIIDVRIRQGIVGRTESGYRLSIELWMTKGPELSPIELASISNTAYRLYPELNTLEGIHLVIKSGVDLAITDSFSHKIYFIDNEG